MYETETYLAHHGIKGQKHGLRRYQNEDGSLTPEGRKRYGIGPARDSKEAIKKKFKELKKNARAENKSAKKAQSEEEQHENLKKYVREHPKTIYKNRTKFSSSEVDDLIKNIEFDRKIKDVRDAEIKRGWDKIQSVSNNLGTISNLTNNAINTWNNSSAIYNALVENGVITSDKKMPKINR